MEVDAAFLCQLQVPIAPDRPLLLDAFLHGGEESLAKAGTPAAQPVGRDQWYRWLRQRVPHRPDRYPAPAPRPESRRHQYGRMVELATQTLSLGAASRAFL